MVRWQTLGLLTRLVTEDYIKWKGIIFFHFCRATVSPPPPLKARAMVNVPPLGN